MWEAIQPKDDKGVVDDKIDKRALAVIYQGIPEDLLLASKEAWSAVIEQFGNLEEMFVEEVIGSLKAYKERLRGKTEKSH